MGLPRILQNMNVFLDGTSYFGEAEKVKLPKLTRKTEDGRNGIKADLGLEAIELEHTYAGLLPAMFDGFGAAKIDAALVRFAGAYDNPATGSVDAIEITVHGRHNEIDPGDAEAGKKSEVTIKTDCVFYELKINGKEIIYIDRRNYIERYNGNDRTADHRKAIGL